MNTAVTIVESEIGVEVPVTATIGLARAVPTLPWMLRIEEHPAWEVLSQMKMRIRAEASLGCFRVRDLLALTEGQVFETRLQDSEDVPIKIESVQLGWGEFEVVEQRMALRITRLD